MNFWMDNSLEELLNVIKKANIVIINDQEALQLSGKNTLFNAADEILKMGPEHVVIKKGEHGALLFGDNNIFYAPALPLEEVFDPTGAGDTFAGGFVGHLSSCDTIDWEAMKKAIIVGSAMASFTVEKFGIEKLIELDKSQIEKRINEFKNLVSFN